MPLAMSAARVVGRINRARAVEPREPKRRPKREPGWQSSGAQLRGSRTPVAAKGHIRCALPAARAAAVAALRRWAVQRPPQRIGTMEEWRSRRCRQVEWTEYDCKAVSSTSKVVMSGLLKLLTLGRRCLWRRRLWAAGCCLRGISVGVWRRRRPPTQHRSPPRRGPWRRPWRSPWWGSPRRRPWWTGQW